MRNVIEYMLQANKDPDRDVALETCEFWYAEIFGNRAPFQSFRASRLSILFRVAL